MTLSTKEQNVTARLGTFVYKQMEECFNTPEYRKILDSMVDRGIINAIEASIQTQSGQTTLTTLYRL